MVWIKRILLTLVALAIVWALVNSFLPQPARVDVETISTGPLLVSVRDDGMTRLRERYVVSTPISGRLQRITWDVGDEVTAGKSVIARMEPTAPDLLDPRSLAQAQARVKAAEGRLRRAKTEVDMARANFAQSEVDIERFRKMRQQGASTDAQVEAAELTYRTRSESLKGGEFLAEIAEYELQQEQAALLHVSGEGGSGETSEFEIQSPISGRVLRVAQESAAVLTAGSPLLELGDPHDLEVVVDVLSSDAVRVKPGQRALFEHWGGEAPIEGVVRLVEPSGFTKISALGVEEQRVNVVIDFARAADQPLLGDGYRVEANVIVWEQPEVLTVSTGSLFREGTTWKVFVVEGNRAVSRTVEVGQNSGLRAQILKGVAKGERVILHPNDQISDGVAVELRTPATAGH